MKIISLHFKNLNSLKGEFKIDFTSQDLANAGLFAITGPTGAGKSTILDAISLALYSSTPRLGGINKNTITDKGVIVARQTKEAFSHLVFEVKGVTYKAEWAIAMTNRGSWGKVVHKLNEQGDGDDFVSITEKVSDTANKIIEIVGLQEDQFSKAIVLSQGKFDEFLQAKKDERYNLLEIITGTQIYRIIGQAVFKALVAQNNILEQLEMQKNNVALLSPEELEEINLKMAEIKQRIKDLGPQIKELEDLIGVKERLNKLKNEAEELDRQTKELNYDSDKFKSDAERLKNHEIALPLQVSLARWGTLTSEIAGHEKSMVDLEASKSSQEEMKVKLLNKLSQDSGEAVPELEFTSKLKHFTQVVRGVDEEKQQVWGRLQTMENTINTLYGQIPNRQYFNLEGIVDSIEDVIAFIETQDAVNLSVELPERAIQIGLAAFIEESEAQDRVYEHACNSKHNLDMLNTRLVDVNNLLAANETAWDALNTENAASQARAEATGVEVAQLEVAQQAYLAVSGLAVYRAALVEGEACPCCGSEEHPYAIDAPILDNTIGLALANAQALQQENAAHLQVLTNQILLNRANQEQLQQREQEIGVEMEASLMLFTSYCETLNLPDNITSEALKAAHESVLEALTAAKKRKIWEDTRGPLRSYVDELVAFDATKMAMAKLNTRRDALLEAPDVLVYQNDLLRQWNNCLHEIDAAKQGFTTHQESVEMKKAEFEPLQRQLISNVIALGLESIESLKMMLLEDEIVSDIKGAQTELERRKVSLDTRRAANVQASSEASSQDDQTKSLDDLTVDISKYTQERDDKLKEQGDLNRQLLEDKGNKEQVAALLLQIETASANRAYYQTLADLIGDSTGNKFNNIIQRITLRHLFQMTNARLATLMDRYQVDLGGEGQEDEIWVIDTYMGDEKRTINSVCGGERFVISLAMALALSDLASNNVKIDSLFIDEGFGSLSAEHLDNAISMLERMQVESEKTIGIISHVESLKERITTQIIVDKLQNGVSTISLKSHTSLTSLAINA